MFSLIVFLGVYDGILALELPLGNRKRICF